MTIQQEIKLLTQEVKSLARELEKRLKKLEKLQLQKEKEEKKLKAKNKKPLPKILKHHGNKAKQKIKKLFIKKLRSNKKSFNDHKQAKSKN